MTDWEDTIREYARVREEAARVRVAAIRTRIVAVNSWCALAESDIEYHSLDGARATMEKIHKAMSELNYHLRLPEHVPPSAFDELWNMLEKLDKKVREVEQRIPSELNDDV